MLMASRGRRLKKQVLTSFFDRRLSWLVNGHRGTKTFRRVGYLYSYGKQKKAGGVWVGASGRALASSHR